MQPAPLPTDDSARATGVNHTRADVIAASGLAATGGTGTSVIGVGEDADDGGVRLEVVR